MSKVRITDKMVDAINNICNDEPEEVSISWEDFSDWNKPKGPVFYKLHGEDYNRMIWRLMRERSNSIILKQNAQLRKDGYTGPFLGAWLLDPPPQKLSKVS